MNGRNRCTVYVFLVLAFMGWLSPPIFVGKIECTVSSRMCEVSTPFQLGRQSHVDVPIPVVRVVLRIRSISVPITLCCYFDAAKYTQDRSEQRAFGVEKAG